jgi:Uma2 family endonuclease
MDTQPKLLTAEEFFWLDDENARELIEGVVYVAPPPGYRHGRVASTADRRFGNYVEDHELGVCCGAETGFRIRRNPDTVRAPDFAFISANRVPSDENTPGYIDLAPDLVIEVISPSDRAGYVQRKMQEWIDAGVRLALAFYPDTMRIAVHEPGHVVKILGPDDEFDGGEVLPGFRCQVKDLFPRSAQQNPSPQG